MGYKEEIVKVLHVADSSFAKPCRVEVRDRDEWKLVEGYIVEVDFLFWWGFRKIPRPVFVDLISSWPLYEREDNRWARRYTYVFRPPHKIAAWLFYKKMKFREAKDDHYHWVFTEHGGYYK